MKSPSLLPSLNPDLTAAEEALHAAIADALGASQYVTPLQSWRASLLSGRTADTEALAGLTTEALANLAGLGDDYRERLQKHRSAVEPLLLEFRALNPGKLVQHFAGFSPSAADAVLRVAGDVYTLLYSVCLGLNVDELCDELFGVPIDTGDGMAYVPPPSTRDLQQLFAHAHQ